MDGWMDGDFMFFWRSRTRKDNTACMRLGGGGGLAGISRSSISDEKIAKGRQKRGVPF
jgi:hypothetical protein